MRRYGDAARIMSARARNTGRLFPFLSHCGIVHDSVMLRAAAVSHTPVSGSDPGRALRRRPARTLGRAARLIEGPNLFPLGNETRERTRDAPPRR